ncbi:restriction endonuclease subunit S [Anaerosalibacter bizertensis]|uniref:restriction endonuclease subunit S n=1 Tax=Anaerosalibacter bizertensis TaxID=932217 RepID=UPI003510DE06
MEWIELGELTEIQTGKLNANAAVENGKYPFFTCADEISYIDEYEYDKECILVAGNGNLNVKYYNGKFNAYQRTYIIESKDTNKLNTIYLFYFMNTYMHKLRDLSIGGVIKYIKLGHLTGAKIPVPPMKIQKKIVEVLDEAQKLIDNRKKQIELLDDLIESIFYDMFGDPVKNDKGWEVKKLGELGKLERGKSKHRPRNDPSLYGGKYPFIQTGDIANSGLYLTDYETTYSEKGLRQSKLWGKNTLCITIAANIAKTSILNIEACFPDSVVGFISNKHSNVIYIRTWFLFFQDIIEKSAPKSAQRNINLKILNNLDVIAPPLSLQNQFAEKVQAIEKQKELLKESLKLMEDNYNSLMQRAFKGELF